MMLHHVYWEVGQSVPDVLTQPVTSLVRGAAPPAPRYLLRTGTPTTQMCIFTRPLLENKPAALGSLQREECACSPRFAGLLRYPVSKQAQLSEVRDRRPDREILADHRPLGEAVQNPVRRGDEVRVANG